MNRVLQYYKENVVKELTEKFGYTTVMQVPKIEKIVVNIGVGDATGNSKLIDDSVKELQQITGQKPVVTKAKKSIASFKVREGHRQSVPHRFHIPRLLPQKHTIPYSAFQSE